mmetsp:Transcript_13298/g.31075  ORF Transcript_13298/g.31075 Transcript_13298/m.31075 type:complete len:213 (-) Transcript_13298:341-979(-)
MRPRCYCCCRCCCCCRRCQRRNRWGHGPRLVSGGLHDLAGKGSVAPLGGRAPLRRVDCGSARYKRKRKHKQFYYYQGSATAKFPCLCRFEPKEGDGPRMAALAAHHFRGRNARDQQLQRRRTKQLVARERRHGQWRRHHIIARNSAAVLARADPLGGTTGRCLDGNRVGVVVIIIIVIIIIVVIDVPLLSTASLLVKQQHERCCLFLSIHSI